MDSSIILTSVTILLLILKIWTVTPIKYLLHVLAIAMSYFCMTVKIREWKLKPIENRGFRHLDFRLTRTKATDDVNNTKINCMGINRNISTI